MLSCTVAWRVLHRTRIKESKLKKSDMPQRAPTIKETIRWIAGNGEVKGRKSDGYPGLISFWREWNRVIVGAEVYEMLT